MPDGMTEIEIELDDETYAMLQDLVKRAHAKGDLDATESSVLSDVVLKFLDERSDVPYQVEVVKPDGDDATLADEYAKASRLLDLTPIEGEPT
jgi:hypothetical protein